MVDEHSTLLICTVGGSHEPIVAALKHWRPMRVQFVHTPQTKDDVDGKIIPKAREGGVCIDAGRYDLFALSDAQDLASCLDGLRELTSAASQWAARGPSFRVVVDFTGGTKCMTAAIAIQASRWPCIFSYVGGGERTRDGVGVVVSGAERIVRQANPWDTLGCQAVEDFVVLFDKHAFLAAADIAAVARDRVSPSRPDRKSEMNSLVELAKALDAWDRFDHKASKDLLERVTTKSANYLRDVLGSARGDHVLAGAARLVEHLDQLGQATPPSRYHLLDLLANAKRRKNEGRFDDAAARLYRAIEAIAQAALKDGHGIESTEKVPLERIPKPLYNACAPRANEEGIVALGLQDTYALLAALNDPVGIEFDDTGLRGKSSPLAARNHSILAHGFEPVPEAVVDRLWKSARSLAKVDAASLPSFPAIAEPGENS